MNTKAILKTAGQMVGVEGIFMALSSFVALYFREYDAMKALLISAAIAAVCYAATLFLKPQDRVFAKEGFVTVSLSWVVMALLGALPFILTGAIPSYIDAVFETVSGLTTTGATILTNVGKMERGLLFWRSLTHWIGGMGVLVLVLAISPSSTGRSIHFARAEMPGPSVTKVVPKMRTYALILYGLYVGLTALEAILLLAGGMPLFDAAIHAFGTAGTGGFGIYADSVASYSPYLQWVIAVFMMLFGVNFNLYYFLVIGSVRDGLRNSELWLYLSILAAATVTITLNLFFQANMAFSDSLRNAFFQTTSFVSTTGFTTADLEAWPNLARGVLFILMFLGGCAGSTAGGLKISRLLMMFKISKNSFSRMLHPRSVKKVMLDGKAVDEETVSGVTVYFILYVLCQAILFLFLSLDNRFDLISNLTASITTFNNVGPAFGAGAAGFAAFSPLSKGLMSVAMLLGRLEIYPILITLSPSTWLKK